MIEGYRKSEIRSKKIIRIILSFCIGILVLLILVKVLSGLKISVLLPIKQVQIYGNKYVNNSDIMKQMNLNTDRSIFFYSTRATKLAILEDKRISGIELVKVYPDTLRIYVAEKERKYLFSNSDRMYWLSSDGIVLEDVTERINDTSPFITMNSNNDDIKIGNKVENFMIEGLLSSIGAFEKDYSEFYKRILSFVVDEKGVYVRLKENNYRIYFGNTITKEKFEKLRALIIVLESTDKDQSKKNTTMEIDMSFSNAAVRKGELRDE